MTTTPSESHRLWVNDFDDAVKQLIALLRDSDGTAQSKTKAFYFRGWCGYGLGASAVLRAIAGLLKSTASDASTRKHFGKIIHVDCSMWKSRRAMQRAIAEELNLRHLMPTFDKQDEEDDFRGVDDSSRAEITSIGSVINQSLRNERFLMIFHYGGHEDIDLAECGIPGVGPFGEGKLLWTNHGRFQLSQREQKLISSYVNIYMYFGSHVGQQLPHLLHKEAVEVIGYTGTDVIDPAIVVDCFLYSIFLTEQVRTNSIRVDYGWATHACNYWICDGILQGDRAWEMGNALYGVIRRFGYSSDQTRDLAYYLDRPIKPYEGWNSITSDKLGAQNISTVPGNASSYFLTFEGDGQLELRNDLFQPASNLRVLKLRKCSFDFASPPFLCCQNLRFLWLDQCTNTGKEQGEGPCFPNLMVLDVRSTDYLLLPQMIELMTNLRELNTERVSWRTISHACRKLQNLQKLRLTESSEVITVDSCSSVDMMNLVLLDLSGNTHMESLPAMSSARSLKMLVLDGCSSLEHVALERAPLLEIFSFDGYGSAENWTHSIQLPKKELRPKSRAAPIKAKVRKISLEGCARLCSIFLRALPNLEELNLSGTAIKTFDLGAMDVQRLKKLFLLGCEQLRHLLWDGNNPTLEVLHVDTRGKARPVVCCGELGCITFTDGRFLWSGTRIVGQVNKVHVHVCSMLHSEVSITKNIEVIGLSQVGLIPTGLLLLYKDIGLTEDVVCSALMWDCQQLQALDAHIEIGEGSHNLESMHDNDNFISFLHWNVQSLHVHDSSSITAITPRVPVLWKKLEWCHVERCPKLHTLFTCDVGYYIFPRLKKFSACDLLMGHCIWSKGIYSQSVEGLRSFEGLQHIYLHNCPRLVFVLPISFTLPSLETLQIEYCSNLKHIFPLDDKYPEVIADGVTFNKLKHIKLQHLHKLEQICQARLSAPTLEMISLRDCWRLRRLPAVPCGGLKPVVDCEKDWWDKLEWDGLEANHGPSLFKTRHSAYYKKSIPRGSLLR